MFLRKLTKEPINNLKKRLRFVAHVSFGEGTIY